MEHERRFNWMYEWDRLPSEIKKIMWEYGDIEGTAKWMYSVAYENVCARYHIDLMLRSVLGKRNALDASGVPQDVIEELDRMEKLALAEEAAMDEAAWEERFLVADND